MHASRPLRCNAFQSQLKAVIGITGIRAQSSDNNEVNLTRFSLKKDLTRREEPPELEALGIPFVDSEHPMWVYDLQTLGFLEVNDAAVRIYGFSRQEFLTMTLIDIRPPKDIPRFLHSWNHPHESTEEKWWHQGKDGRAFPVSITSWELMFRGRKAELVRARRDDKDASHADGGDIQISPDSAEDRQHRRG